MGGVSQRPKGGNDNFFGKKTIKNEFSTIKLVKVQIFSQIGQLLKKSLLKGGNFQHFLGGNAPLGEELEFFGTQHWCQII